MDASGLRSKAGPLPIWAWGALLGLVAVGFIYWRSSNSAASNAAAVAPGTAGATDPTVDYQAAGLGATQADSSSVPADTSSTPVFQNNDTWVSGIVQWLNGQGQDPIKVRQALTTYLNGGILSPAQVAIIKSAIGYAGDAPDGLAGTPTEAVVPTTPPPGSVIGHVGGTHPAHVTPKAPTKRAPVRTVTYRIVSGDSLSRIAKHFYGSASEANIKKIQDANHIKNPNVIISGHTLVIPK